MAQKLRNPQIRTELRKDLSIRFFLFLIMPSIEEIATKYKVTTATIYTFLDTEFPDWKKRLKNNEDNFFDSQKYVKAKNAILDILDLIGSPLYKPEDKNDD